MHAAAGLAMGSPGPASRTVDAAPVGVGGGRRAAGAGALRGTWRPRTSPRFPMWTSTRTASSTDIYDKVASEMQKKGYDCECLGGGRISHQSQDKKIHVYGYSMGFGRAQHSVSTEKIKAMYPDYEVTWADDGY
ncbi:14 kDa phosphohistidine phosphatase isoform X1 [Sturnira hondurensis]|uniref:14 kDa phosphohistidine phosphatase isoform X1 n=1 Tax=Sturnira hondurensis TaxID=192404 RepID=UPI0018798A77|nr:14 kDa phosphohistidine phosphatase isoform X1 [Sturnira hondurensis]